MYNASVRCGSTVKDHRPLRPVLMPERDCAATQMRAGTLGAFSRLLTGSMLGREDDSGTGEKRYWRARPCNTAQEGGEASALGSNGWRGSMSALGIGREGSPVQA